MSTRAWPLGVRLCTVAPAVNPEPSRSSAGRVSALQWRRRLISRTISTPGETQSAQGVALCATSAGDASAPTPSTLQEKLSDFLSAFWKFLRPHTIRGTVLGSVTVTARALIENPDAINWSLFPVACIGVLAVLCGNGFIVGINQIYDIHIDKVNKPFLPVASKELSVFAAWSLVVGLAGVGITLATHFFGRFIGGLYSFGLLLGMIYSVPPFRLKRFAVPAFLIIATVRGFLLNYGVYYATKAALKLSFKWSPAISFITIFVTVFAVSIAITKDLPDVKGDRRFNIETFATKMGVRRITFLGSGLLLLNYIGASVLACLMPRAFNPSVMILGHAILSGKLISETIHVDQEKYTPESIRRYYGQIWILFYLEYCLLPFI